MGRRQCLDTPQGMIPRALYLHFPLSYTILALRCLISSCQSVGQIYFCTYELCPSPLPKCDMGCYLLQQISVSQMKVDKVQIVGINCSFAVCLDQDERKILHSVTR